MVIVRGGKAKAQTRRGGSARGRAGVCGDRGAVGGMGGRHSCMSVQSRFWGMRRVWMACAEYSVVNTAGKFSFREC